MYAKRALSSCETGGVASSETRGRCAAMKWTPGRAFSEACVVVLDVTHKPVIGSGWEAFAALFMSRLATTFNITRQEWSAPNDPIALVRMGTNGTSNSLHAMFKDEDGPGQYLHLTEGRSHAEATMPRLLWRLHAYGSQSCSWWFRLPEETRAGVSVAQRRPPAGCARREDAGLVPASARCVHSFVAFAACEARGAPCALGKPCLRLGDVPRAGRRPSPRNHLQLHSCRRAWHG